MKINLFLIFLESLEYSFILTMWYVNFKEQYKAWSKEQSFILTMWYVNRYDGNSKTS